MADITLKWADDALKKFERQIVQLQTQFPKVLPQEINKTGDKAKTVVIRTLTKQTGLDRRVIVAAVGNPSQARPGKLTYDMKTRGGNIRLKYLKPKETEDGVVAKPFGVTTEYPGAFMKGGAFPNRTPVPEWNGHVMRRINSRGTRITFARSGVIIPQEMTAGATAEAFQKVAAPLLQARVEKVIKKLLG
ncbi:hypothetical protein [Shinella granuli]|uniref:HK97 gp10 family phage protein n=1 Tax=Shinella granuli TaxID=323621 RepID=A0A4R2D528_SHIGR|nr:hypothetical protein [Shinella granuli]TCN48885.1 hypothetical protein EV665_101624 [Shinella granuli]